MIEEFGSLSLLKGKRHAARSWLDTLTTNGESFARP
jgi:hypothetical protein